MITRQSSVVLEKTPEFANLTAEKKSVIRDSFPFKGSSEGHLVTGCSTSPRIPTCEIPVYFILPDFLYNIRIKRLGEIEAVVVQILRWELG